jgi:hypothetical protein
MDPPEPGPADGTWRQSSLRPRQRLDPRILKSRRHLRGAEVAGYAGIALGVIVIVIGLIAAVVQLLN